MSNPTGLPFAFDEETYLRMNPDVARAIEAKHFSSGWEHAVLHGYMEQRPGLTDEARNRISTFRDMLEHDTADDNPPVELRIRVHGEPNLASFRLKGTIIAGNIEQQLTAHGLSLSQQSNVLDFGCGCGRVISQLSRRYREWSFKGSDIDREAIHWCAEHLGDIAEFRQNDIWPPLEYPASYFDIVYAISVFTHLPEDMQFSWLEELMRVTKSGGMLFLSTHSINLLPDGIQVTRGENDFIYLTGNSTPGLPDFYQTSYHGHDYINNRWSQYFDIISVVPKGINGHQDLVICRRRAF